MKKKFTPGPLMDAAKRLEDFSFNLYFSYVFVDALAQHRTLQDEYIEAFLNNDEELWRGNNVNSPWSKGHLN